MNVAHRPGMIKILKLLPEESYGRLARMFEDSK